MREIRDLDVPMRDGVTLAVDVFLPDKREEAFPALVGMSPYGKDIQSLEMPPQPPTSPIYSREIEAGDPRYLTDHGYAHVIADVRGIGSSGGTYRGWLSDEEALDGYDLVEWVAEQPWCDGEVGMVGVSYYGAVQLHVAATNPPHLKAIMPFNAPADFYRECTYHGGILQTFYLMLYQLKVLGRMSSVTVEDNSPEQLEEIQRALYDDPDIRQYQALYNIAKNPGRNPGFFDIMTHPLDGEYYWSRSPYRHYDEIKIPAYLGSGWWAYGHQHLRGAFQNYLGLGGETRLYIEGRTESPAPMGDEYNARVVRWYDHWLKGVDTGVTDEPPIEIVVRGAGRRFVSDWPPPDTLWKRLYFGRWGTLLDQPERAVTPRDVYIQQSITENPHVSKLNYDSQPFTQETEIIGPMALVLFAAIDHVDTNWIVSLSDLAPDRTAVELTRGFLKASHREIDEEKSEPWRPFHPHLESVPVEPNVMTRYDIEMSPVATVIQKGHRLRLAVSSLDHIYDPAPDLEIGGASHMPTHVGINATVTHHVAYGHEYPSHLLVPITSGSTV